MENTVVEKALALPSPTEQSDSLAAFSDTWLQRLWYETPTMGGGIVRDSTDYWVDAWQRSVLFLDTLRERGSRQAAQAAQEAPHVLSFDFNLVLDGRTFERPVNYALVRIVPPAGVTTDDRKRPFIVFDPRAGHGPGIGGMKHESEIGVALQAGHPCYFVGFQPKPVPGQTIEDVCVAEARFVAKVTELHPGADGRPCLIGNCQAGWQIMMMAALHPDSVGPIVIVGTPLSYWNGVHGKSPMRYTGGLLGGSWLTSLAGDLGDGFFDGANLVANFENMHPSNTLWNKDYHLYANIDTESQRFLEFENWWGSPILLNAGEMQFIVDELFIGNKLVGGEIAMSDGARVDLRNISSPIVVFCSWGDDITPPQQALGWVTDLYESDEDLAVSGQTIVYALHQTIGHLGIFVSAKVATKEHEEFAQTMDLIDALPPGLYEAVFVPKGPEIAHAELVSGDYLVQFQRRRLDDIRALGGNDEADERRFATVARFSEINQGLYRTFVSPLVRQFVTPQTAEWLRRLHPNRLRFEIFSDKSPWMLPIHGWADLARANRKPVAANNPFLALQEMISSQIVDALERYGNLRDRATEAFFLAFYGAPGVQALAGMRTDLAMTRHHPGRDLAREAGAARMAAEMETKFGQGGTLEAAVRALLYVGLGQAQPVADERVFATLRQLRQEQPEDRRISLVRFKKIVRDQHLLLRLDEARALAAIPMLLPQNPTERQHALDGVRRAVGAAWAAPMPVEDRLATITDLFAVGVSAPAVPAIVRKRPAPAAVHAAADA